VRNKFFPWFKTHPILTISVVLIFFWAGHKLWRIGFGLMSHPEPAHVETVIVATKPGEKTWQAIGTVKAAQDIEIASEVSGVVQNIVVANDQQVKQGDILINIRHDDIAANLQRDDAELTQKQLYYNRLQQLSKSNTVSKESLSEALSAFEQADAIAKSDQAQIDKYSIKAAFNGQVGIWQVTPGQLVKPGDMLVTLTDLSPAYVDFMLPPKALGSVAIGNTIQFSTESYPNRKWIGKITAIDPQLDIETRSLQLRAQINNTDGRLIPHLYGQVIVKQPLGPQIQIPQEAVIYDPQGTSVYLLHNKVTALQSIQLGEHIGDNVVITKGLKPGDEVVTAGMMKLFPGMTVIINKQIHQIG